MLSFDCPALLKLLRCLLCFICTACQFVLVGGYCLVDMCMVAHAQHKPPDCNDIHCFSYPSIQSRHWQILLHSFSSLSLSFHFSLLFLLIPLFLLVLQQFFGPPKPKSGTGWLPFSFAMTHREKNNEIHKIFKQLPASEKLIDGQQ